MPTLNLEGLSDEQLALVARFVNLVRRTDKERAREAFGRLWDEWVRNAPPIAEEEAEALVEEAVAFARISA